MENKKQKKVLDSLTAISFSERHGYGAGNCFNVKGIAPNGFWYHGYGQSPALAIRDLINNANADEAGGLWTIVPAFKPGITVNELHSSVTVCDSGKWWVEISPARRAGNGDVTVIVGAEGGEIVPELELLGPIGNDYKLFNYDLNIVIDVDDLNVNGYIKTAIHAVANWVNLAFSNPEQRFEFTT